LKCGAVFDGIGAFLEVDLAYFDLVSKSYVPKVPKFAEMLEVVSIGGNIALLADTEDRIIHMHTGIGTTQFNGYGGHIIDAVVGPALEIKLWKLSKQMYRKVDLETGLPLLDLSRKLKG